MCGCLSHAPYWGPGLQPTHVPWLGIKPATLWFSGQHSIHWATPARASLSIFKSHCFFLAAPLLSPSFLLLTSALGAFWAPANSFDHPSRDPFCLSGWGLRLPEYYVLSSQFFFFFFFSPCSLSLSSLLRNGPWEAKCLRPCILKMPWFQHLACSIGWV